MHLIGGCRSPFPRRAGYESEGCQFVDAVLQRLGRCDARVGHECRVSSVGVITPLSVVGAVPHPQGGEHALLVDC